MPSGLPFRAVVQVAVVLGVTAAAGCGANDEPPGTVPFRSAAPVWHVVRGSQPTEGNGLTIEARSPCRLALRYEGPETAEAPLLSERTLRAGSSVTVVWGHMVVTTGATKVPPPEDAAAGRSDPHILTHRFGYEDGAMEERTVPVWTRPGRGTVLTRGVTPPVADQELPVPSRIELSATAIADVDAGDPILVPAPQGTRVRLPSPASPGDRSVMTRLWLEVLPP